VIHGLDTGFLVAAEVAEHSLHQDARAILARLASAQDQIAIAPQVLAEFVHIVTDARRFALPLDMLTAQHLAEQWWSAADVIHVVPDDGAVQLFFAWLKQFALGRNRLLDTLLAATYSQAGIQSLLTTNPSDFSLFACFTCFVPTAAATKP
jgi:predicted nucleic acid-binding protein